MYDFNLTYGRNVMRGKFLLIAMILAILLCSFVSAAEVKIAYFDTERLRLEWGDWKDAQAKFDEDVQVWQQEAEKMEQEINQLMEDYQRQELMLSENKRIEKQKVIQQEQLEYQEFLSTIFGQGGEAEKRNAKLTKPLYDRIKEALAALANKYGYTAIFDVNGSGIAYVDPSLDITEELLSELGKR